MNRERALAELVKVLEEEQIREQKRQEYLGLNQPSLVAISSTQADIEPETQGAYDQVGYSSFNVKFPSPALNVESLQLLSASIPQCNTNIPNTATTFWYYRLNGYTGQAPNPENLYYVRLLPSYYKQELLNTPNLYGYNQTFKNYPALLQALNLSAQNDVAYENYKSYTGAKTYSIPFLPNEVSFSYDTTKNRFSFTGTNAQTGYAYRQYDPATTYTDTDVVYQNTNTYKSLVNNNTNNPLNNTGFWQQIYLPIVKPYDPDTIYNKGALVQFDGNIYEAQIKSLHQSPNGNYQYDANRTYCQFQVAKQQGHNHTYINPIPASNIPTSNTAYWLPSLYNSATTYPKGFIVEYNNNFFTALKQNLNIVPVDGNDWEEFGDFWGQGADPISNRYLVTGPADPNVKLKQGTDKRQYTEYHLYEVNDVVYHNNVKYRALTQTKGYRPFDTTNYTAFSITKEYFTNDVVFFQNKFYIANSSNIGNYPSALSSFWSVQTWTTTQQEPPIVSLSTISQTFDFFDTELDQTFPVGIPPQPYNPNPKRLLNTILGFTFTGRLTPSIFENISSGAVADLVPSSLLNQYNRLRPVPTYFTEPALLQDHPSYTTQTYTADGFCNLVYSSVLRIYCNLIFDGTLDNNLLGIIPFNCGNLGVAFTNNCLDTKITKIQNEIYEINIRFEDEFGDPFFLTNNAVSTLVLKLTYKDNPD